MDVGLLEKYAILSAITFWRASACYTTIICPYPTGPPTLTLGEEGSWPTEPDPTHGSRPEDPRDYKGPGDYRKVSTHRGQEKPAQETGSRSSEVE